MKCDDKSLYCDAIYIHVYIYTCILPLRIETGLFVNITDSQTGMLREATPIERICNICKMNFIEDEKHFLFVCNKYDEERKI